MILSAPPYSLFQSRKMVDPALRDQLVEEVLSAALGYLKQK
jgi:hypothetical protein